MKTVTKGGICQGIANRGRAFLYFLTFFGLNMGGNQHIYLAKRKELVEVKDYSEQIVHGAVPAGVGSRINKWETVKGKGTTMMQQNCLWS